MKPNKYYMFLNLLHKHQFLLFDKTSLSNIQNYNQYFQYREFVMSLYDQYRLLYKNHVSYINNTNKRFLVKRRRLRKNEIFKVLLRRFIYDITNEILTYLSDDSIDSTFKLTNNNIFLSSATETRH